MQLSHSAIKTDVPVRAVLGPTNTGKTYYAIEEMIRHASGVIGFPLRLLARENYDRLVAMKGAQAVALVTGEEKIIPRHARYYVCTVEAMPVDQDFDFLAVDEVQLCADPERGHVFTDRLLRARGRKLTLFLGSDTMQPIMNYLIPGIEFISRSRLSQLSYKGYKKLTRLPKRSAVVAFSVDDVYAMADLIRRQRGGTAVVLGALSPRTRNRQVEMYQAGEVDFMVATDAIGMGLNMDIHHVALASTRKFDGRHPRALTAAEMAQIAGRAGRHMRDGTFGTTGFVRSLAEEVVEAIETHSFEPVPALYWRNSLTDFTSPAALLGSLECGAGSPVLTRGRPADDYLTLVGLLKRDDILVRAGDIPRVRMLWDVCQIPDFRKIMSENHQELVADVYTGLVDFGAIPEDRVAEQIRRLDRLDGDVDTLMARIAHIRTWTYITHKSEWVRNADEWADKARAIEDRLSDALHEGLMRRFVDRRSAVLIRAMEEGGGLLAGVRPNGEVVVEGEEVGHLEGFRFVPDSSATGRDFKAVMAAARGALRPEIQKRLRVMLNAVPKQFRLNDDGHILYQSDPTNPMPGIVVATVTKGATILQPDVQVIDTQLIEGQDREAVAVKLKEWLKGHIATVLEPLVALEKEEEGIAAPVRGIAFQVHEAMGIIPRAQIEDLIAGLDADMRRVLRQKQVKLGPILVFIPALNKPAAVHLRALLWSLWNDKPLPAKIPADGMVSKSLVADAEINTAFYSAIGYPVYANRAIRVDMLDRLISAIYDSAKDGTFKATHAMAEWLGCSIPDLYAVIEAMGHRKIIDPAEQKIEVAVTQADAAVAAVETPVAQPVEASAETPAPVAAEVVAPMLSAKPELATFRLRKGKAYGEVAERKPYQGKKGEKKEFRNGDKKPFNERKGDHRKPKKESRKPDRLKEHDSREPRVIASAPASSTSESPFSVLQQLKTRQGGQ
ncbi:MAG: helicase [Micavibrio aeruginosavorus]|uniref:Helicase n=1 Tax=Micavibrio aeruginosavorus TaxID=349221 RepID=A0A7T5UIV9_9BACT|nr:MAG: helicase [Micavibrio aeruginosavorus]